MDIYDSTNLRYRAAALLRAAPLHEVQELIENQKSLSTRKLEWMLQNVAEDMRLHAICFIEVAKKLDVIERQQQDSSSPTGESHE